MPKKKFLRKDINKDKFSLEIRYENKQFEQLAGFYLFSLSNFALLYLFYNL